MKEKIETAKVFVREHKEGLVKIGIYAGGVAIGMIIGQWTMIPMSKTIYGLGNISGIHYADANGIEAANNMVKRCFTIGKLF